MSRSTYTERPLGASSAALPSPAYRVSVVVPVLNGASLIEGCLRSLERQTLPRDDYEVVVVDDGSTDGTAAAVRAIAASSPARIVLVERPHGGPAAARNAGLAATSSPVVAFTDADCEVSAEWLASLLARLDADPSLAGVEGRTVPKGTPGTYTHQMSNERGQLYMTCNMAYRRAALGGGFDERFKAAFLEDSDVAFGVLERGGRIEYAPEVLAHHLVLHEGGVKFWRDARKRYYNPLLYRKHRRLYAQLLRPVVPGLPAPYVEYMLALATLGVALGTRAWLAAVPAALLLAFTLKTLRHVLRARTPGQMMRACAVPFVQTFWVVAGMARFRAFGIKI